jgi:hypothetical protein
LPVDSLEDVRYVDAFWWKHHAKYGEGNDHRGTEDTKLRKDRENLGASDFGNPVDGLSALHNPFHGLAH